MTRLTPERRDRLKRLAGKASQAALAERFGLSERHVQRILSECPDCATCGAPTVPGATTCQRCAEGEYSQWHPVAVAKDWD